MAQESTKKWYQSKIFLLGAVMFLVGVTNWATGWLTGRGVTPEQLQVIQDAQPTAIEGIKEAIETKKYFDIVTSVGGFVTMIFRAWFTTVPGIAFK